MKKIIAAVLSTAIALSCVSAGVYAEATSSVYTIDTAAKTITNVKPLTKVSAFKANIADANVEVVNVDGSVMADDAYATENVFAVIDGEYYTITEKYGYEPIANSNLADGAEIYNVAANAATNTNLSSGGFVRTETVPKIGYGSDAESPANTAEQTLKATKSTRGGEGVYVLENDSNKYSLLRSHYSSSNNYSTTLNSIRDSWSTAPIVTSFEFEADKLGNISLFHNTPARDANKTMTKGDTTMDSLFYGAEFTYVPSSIHFLEDGSVKLGGIYSNTYKSYRTPSQLTDFTWEAGKKYNVSIVQRYLRGKREAYVDGVYVNGTKIFPNAKTVGHADGRVALQSDGSFKIGTKSSSVTHGGDISSILIGTAPKTADDNLTVYLSDIKVYGLASAADFNANITKTDITLPTMADITVSEADAVIADAVAETVSDFTKKFPADVVVGVYDADGTLVDDDAYLTSDMIVKTASVDGLQGKTYKLNATEYVSKINPESEVYTVDVEAKTISGVKPLTTVADFLANFKNGDAMKVVNIDDSVMSASAYATENVSAVAPNGDLYRIVVKYPYSPIQTDGAYLDNGRELYNKAATEIANSSMIHTGFDRVQVYDKIGYGSDVASPENTADQTVKATKQTENGAPVYVLENDSNKYAYIRSDYSDSTNYSTAFNGLIDSWTKNPIVTTVEFEADKLGNISVFNNTPVRNGSKNITKGDAGVDGLIYSVEAPYAPNSVHFLEDGKVKLGGIYSNYGASTRTPAQETDFTWEPGKKYTVSIVQRYFRGAREGYVDAVYVNGTKIFPNAKTVSHKDGRVALQADGTFKIGTKDGSTTHGGGLSSIMIGTAPKTADENLKVTVSDVKVYTTSAYNPACDADITIASTDGTVVVDNENAVIYCIGTFDASTLSTTAKFVVDGDKVKAVSADGLVAKTYTVVKEDLRTAFMAGQDGKVIESLADAGDEICFAVDVDDSQLPDGSSPAVMLGLYKGNDLVDVVMATGVKYNNEITKYKAVLDISDYNKNEIEVRGFAWDGFKDMLPLAGATVLK